VNTLSEEKSKSDAVDAGLPQAAADKCEKCGLAHHLQEDLFQVQTLLGLCGAEFSQGSDKE
jgi:hypothetical protein